MRAKGLRMTKEDWIWYRERRVERALAELDRQDAEEERLELVGAVGALAFVAAVLALPAAVLSLSRGAHVLWLPAVAGVLGSTPLLRRLRRRAMASLRDDPVLPPPRPTTTSIWRQADSAEAGR